MQKHVVRTHLAEEQEGAAEGPARAGAGQRLDDAHTAVDDDDALRQRDHRV